MHTFGGGSISPIRYKNCFGAYCVECQLIDSRSLVSDPAACSAPPRQVRQGTEQAWKFCCMRDSLHHTGSRLRPIIGSHHTTQPIMHIRPNASAVHNSSIQARRGHTTACAAEDASLSRGSSERLELHTGGESTSGNLQWVALLSAMTVAVWPFRPNHPSEVSVTWQAETDGDQSGLFTLCLAPDLPTSRHPSGGSCR